VDPEDLQLAGQPLHLLDEHLVARVGADVLRRPVGHRVRPAAHHPEAALRGGRADLAERGTQVGLRLADGGADVGDDLDGRLEELVLGLRMLVVTRVRVPVGRAELTEDLAGAAAEVPGLEVDELQLPLHAQAGPW
jgi:hypothetical protein